MLSMDGFPSIREHNFGYRERHAKKSFRTVHDHLHVVEQTIDHLHGLRRSQLQFIYCETAQPLQHGFDIVLS